MVELENTWSRELAEKRIGEVLDAAKLGRKQRLTDGDGVFEIVYLPPDYRKPLGDFLSKGGPVAD